MSHIFTQSNYNVIFFSFQMKLQYFSYRFFSLFSNRSHIQLCCVWRISACCPQNRSKNRKILIISAGRFRSFSLCRKLVVFHVSSTDSLCRGQFGVSFNKFIIFMWILLKAPFGIYRLCGRPFCRHLSGSFCAVSVLKHAEVALQRSDWTSSRKKPFPVCFY